MHAKPTTRNTILASCVLGVLGLAVVFGPRAAGAPPRPKASPSPAVAVTGPATWKEVDRLVGEQKFEAASAVVGRIRAKAMADGNEADWTRALVREVQLRTALHGYETAVRFLREEPWPKGHL